MENGKPSISDPLMA